MAVTREPLGQLLAAAVIVVASERERVVAP